MIAGVSAGDAAPYFVAVVALVGTYVANRIQSRTARTSPATVADGYGALVADLRSDLNRLRIDLEAERVACNRRISALEREIADLRGDP